MCVSPNYIVVTKVERPERLEVPCRECWACRLNRQNDLIGRGLADFAYSDAGIFLTLTYDDKKLQDPSQATTIHKRDLQNFLKLWRKHVGKTRYIAAGEYGGKKGRTHFHAVLFTQGHCPVYPKNIRFWDEQIWPWGHMWAEPVTMKTIKYVAKYLIKQKESGEEWVTYSRFPLLGHDFCQEIAWQAAKQQVFPRDFNYYPPGYTGRPKLKFSFYGKAQETILDTIFDLWPEAYDVPKTPWMENALRRYKKIKARRSWDSLPMQDRAIYLDDDLRAGLTYRPEHQTAIERLNYQNEADLWAGQDAKNALRLNKTRLL